MKETIMIYGGELLWTSVQETAQNAVVQVVAQVATFDWCEPYRVHDQEEIRGTGFFIDEEGHIITNAHVVDQARTVWIHLPLLGKPVIFADVVSFCPDRDIALLRIDKAGRDILKQEFGGIVPLALGDSDAVQRVDNVLVLGYPLGQHGIKSSTGIISGRESGNGRSLIQITAPVNPGNSGAPLLNARGQVIGITIATVFLAQNIGYAIPINELKVVLDQLYTQPFVRKASLGAQFNYASPEHAQFFGNPLPAGFYISKILKDSLLEKAGVRAGDMLYELNGFRLDAFGEVVVPWSNDKVSVHDLVARFTIGDTITCLVYREGMRLDLSFKFELTPLYPIRCMYPLYEPVRYELFGGMVVMQLADNHLPLLAPYAPALVSYVDIDHKVEPRLVISHIIPGCVVQQARCLEIGDIIRQVNGVGVTTLDDFVRAVYENRMRQLVTIQTQEGVLGVFSLKKIIEDEPRLSHDFSYPISPLMKMLLNDEV